MYIVRWCNNLDFLSVPSVLSALGSPPTLGRLEKFTLHLEQDKKKILLRYVGIFSIIIILLEKC